MEATLIVPDPVLVRDACDRFDRENEVTEKALSDLFDAYPANCDPSRVLLKVVALNSLYSTRILAVLKLAAHIAGQGAAIDAALAAGSPEAVDSIARISMGEKDFIFYSFATKYCNWHQPNLYPIFDSRVDKYLWLLKKQGLFQSQDFSSRQDLYSYPSFCSIMTAFRNQFGLASFTFKQIDKFLWSQGESIWVAAEEGAREESSALQTPPPQALSDHLNPGIEPPVESLPASAEAPAFESEDYDPEFDLPSEYLKRRRTGAQADIRLNPDLIVDASPGPRDEPPEGEAAP
jgi:hypothetical protein